MNRIQENRKAPRLAWVDTLRGIAAFAVVLHHYYWILVPIGSPLSRLFDAGVFGVGLFFCISGFVIPFSIKIDKKSILIHFLAGRAFRLYPAYWLSLGIGILAYSASRATLIANITMMQRFIGFQDLIGVYWTLQIEILFYVFTALTLALGLFARPWVVTTAGIGASILAIALGAIRYFLHKKAPLAVPIGLSIIMMGNLYYLMKKDQIKKNSFTLTCIIICTFISASIFLGYSRDWGYGENPLRFILSYSLAFATFLFAAQRPQLNLKLATWMGTISYPLYLLHQPFHALAERWLGAGSMTAASVALAFVIPASAAVHHWIELPGVRLGRALIENRHKQLHASG